MWLLWEIFDDVVDIAFSPIKATWHIIDEVIDWDIEWFVDDIKSSMKTK